MSLSQLLPEEEAIIWFKAQAAAALASQMIEIKNVVSGETIVDIRYSPYDYEDKCPYIRIILSNGKTILIMARLETFTERTRVKLEPSVYKHSD